MGQEAVRSADRFLGQSESGVSTKMRGRVVSLALFMKGLEVPGKTSNIRAEEKFPDVLTYVLFSDVNREIDG